MLQTTQLHDNDIQNDIHNDTFITCTPQFPNQGAGLRRWIGIAYSSQNLDLHPPPPPPPQPPLLLGIMIAHLSCQFLMSRRCVNYFFVVTGRRIMAIRSPVIWFVLNRDWCFHHEYCANRGRWQINKLIPVSFTSEHSMPEFFWTELRTPNLIGLHAGHSI